MAWFPFEVHDPALRKKLEEYVREHQDFLSNPVIQSFLREKKHQQLFAQWILDPSDQTREVLDHAFKEYYSDIRLISYISTLIQRNAIDYEKKSRKHHQRFPLILDQSAPYASPSKQASDLPSAEDHLEQSFADFASLIEDPLLHRAIHQLTDTQRYIIQLSYIHDMKDEEIAKHLGISQQAVSKSRRNALWKIYRSLRPEEGREKDGGK